MDTLPELERLSEREKDALIVALWAEVQRLRTRLAVLQATLHAPGKGARNSSMPPSKTRKVNTPARPPQETRREASVGRAGGGRPLHPDPDQVIRAQAKVCPHCGHEVPAAGQSLQAVYDKIEVPPVKPIVTRVEQYGGRRAGPGYPLVGPPPCGDGTRSPFCVPTRSVSSRTRHEPRD